MTRTSLSLAALVLTLAMGVATSSAQQPPDAPAPAPAQALLPPPPPPPPPTWTGTAGAGVSLTRGNTDTVNYNLAFDLTRDPKTRTVQKMKGLFIRSEQEEALTANHLALAFRHQYALTPRAYVFGQVDYLRDTFKRIDYLVAPTVGIGLKIVDTAATKFSVDAGIGAVREKNPDVEADTSVALTAGEKLEHQLTATTTLKHAATALWKADDFADGLYTVSVGVGLKISDHLQFTVDVLDTFKNRPPTAATGRNDLAIVTALAAKL